MKRKYRLNRFLTVELVHVMAARGDCITDYGYQTTIRMRYLEPHDMVRTFDHEMCHLGEQHRDMGAGSETVAIRVATLYAHARRRLPFYNTK